MAVKAKDRPKTTTIQVDREVYSVVLRRKASLEQESGRTASLNDALRAALGLKAK